MTPYRYRCWPWLCSGRASVARLPQAERSADLFGCLGAGVSGVALAPGDLNMAHPLHLCKACDGESPVKSCCSLSDPSGCNGSRDCYRFVKPAGLGVCT